MLENQHHLFWVYDAMYDVDVFVNVYEFYEAFLCFE